MARCGRPHPFPINLFPSLLCSACRARNSGTSTAV